MTLDTRTWKPMLAATAPATDDSARHLAGQGYTFDWKWDGIRSFAIVRDGEVRLVNRNGTDITFRYPDLASAEALRERGNIVLDGEIIVFDPATGKPAFKWAHQRDAFGPGRTGDIARWAAAYPATFVAFDLLAKDDTDMRTMGLGGRLNVLDTVVWQNDRFLAKSLRSDDGVALLNVVREQGGEGIIAKRLQASYRAGRKSDWLKMKPTRTCTALVTGYEPGEGWRAAYFGALHIAVLDANGALVSIGKVGSGFTIVELQMLEPFVKSGVELVIEVEYQERQPGTGVLRFPVYKGLRTDVARTAASLAQFGTSNGDADAA